MEKLYVVMTSIRLEHAHKVAYEFQKVKTARHVPGSAADLYAKTLTRYASELVMKQLDLAAKVKGFAGTEGAYTIDSCGGTINVTTVSCQCMFRRAMDLPCRHILALRKQSEIDVFDISLCGSRWHLEHYKNVQRLYTEIESNGTESNITIIEKTKKPMTQEQKFRLASKETSDLPTIMCQVGKSEFKRRMDLIRQLKEGWKEGRVMMVAHAESYSTAASHVLRCNDGGVSDPEPTIQPVQICEDTGITSSSKSIMI